jgi:hypothetical protein
MSSQKAGKGNLSQKESVMEKVVKDLPLSFSFSFKSINRHSLFENKDCRGERWR